MLRYIHMREKTTVSISLFKMLYTQLHRERAESSTGHFPPMKGGERAHRDRCWKMTPYIGKAIW